MNKTLHALCLSLLTGLLAGCQINHTLSEPTLDTEKTLPPVSVTTAGSIPGDVIRNRMRRLGVFEQVRTGFDPAGYNIQVLSTGDWYGFNNLGPQFLSAFTLFIVPASVSWDSDVVFRVSRGQEEISRYRISNKTSHYNGLFVHPDGRGDNARRIVDSFVAQAQADASLFEVTPLKPLNTPMPVAPATLQRRVELTARLQVQADGSVSEVEVIGEANEHVIETVRETLRSWNYQAWTAGPQAPPSRTISQRIVLEPQSILGTQQQSCAQVMSDLQAFQVASPGKPPSDLSTFQQTSATLFLETLRQSRDAATAASTDKAFAAALPWIIEQCKANPQTPYWQYVGEGVKRQRPPTDAQPGS